MLSTCVFTIWPYIMYDNKSEGFVLIWYSIVKLGGKEMVRYIVCAPLLPLLVQLNWNNILFLLVIKSLYNVQWNFKWFVFCPKQKKQELFLWGTSRPICPKKNHLYCSCLTKSLLNAQLCIYSTLPDFPIPLHFTLVQNINLYHTTLKFFQPPKPHDLP